MRVLSTTILTLRSTLHFFEHLESIDDIIVFSCRKDALRLAKVYGLEVQDKGFDADCDVSWYGMSASAEDILFSDTVLKLVF